MRIGIDARPLAVPTTGIGRYTQEIVTRLSHSGHELFLCGFQPLAVTFDMPNVHVRVAGRQLPLASTVHSQTTFTCWARQDRIDVFWSPRHHLPLFSSLPGVVTVHDMVWKLQGETMIRLGRLIESLLMPASLRKARRIIAVSQATASDIVAFYPEVASKITVIAEAASLSNVQPSDAPLPGGPYMLFVGTLEPRKNLQRILEAFQTLLESGISSHRLVIAGNSGWKNDAIHQMLQNNELAACVELLGTVDNDRLVALYQGADFVVAPSLFEGFGLVVVEAMSLGVPVITANVSALPEVAGDAALLVDPMNVAAIGEAMRRLIEDRQLHTELSRRGLDRAGLFSWDRAAAETLDVLEAAYHGG